MKTNKIMAAVIAVVSLAGIATAGDTQSLQTPRQAWRTTHVWWVKGTPATPLTPVGYSKYNDYYVVTSPKGYQRIDEERAQLRAQESGQPEANRVVAYNPTGADGITASPKFRQFLNEHPTYFQVAPVK